MSNTEEILPSAEEILEKNYQVFLDKSNVRCIYQNNFPEAYKEAALSAIKEAMEIARNKSLELAAEKAETNGGGDFPNEINKSSILNLKHNKILEVK